MKKLSIAILAFLILSVSACNKTTDTAVTAKDDTAKTTAATTKAATTTTAATTTKAPLKTAAPEEDPAEEVPFITEEYGIELDTYYYPCGNASLGSFEFFADGTFAAEIADKGGSEGTWTADEYSVYLQNNTGEELPIDVYEDGGVFVLVGLPFAVSGYENSESYSGTFLYEGDHSWLDVMILDGSNYGDYGNLVDGEIVDSNSAVVLTYDNYLVLTQTIYDYSNAPAILVTYDGGATFEDDNYSYNPADGEYSTEPDNSVSYSPEEIGIELNRVYSSGNENVNFFYFTDDGYFMLCDPVSEDVVDLNYEIYGDEVTVYDGEGTVVANMTFDGYSFYEPESGLSFYPE
jgi:hypothetical protein